jgi:pyruvate dehydrogenase E2 component (dihydrolipoamide acetyltransferase)
MATEVKLPRLGQGMESGVVVKWLKSEGDKVEKGDVLYELETEKVTQEVEAEASGVLLKITVPEGEADVGTTLAIIGEEGEDVDLSPADAGESSNGGRPPAASAEEVDEEPQEEGSRAPARDEERERGRDASAPARASAEPRVEPAEGRVKASPLARRIARERGIDLAAVSGTGPEGRIVAEDVERAAAAPVAVPGVAGPPPGEVETIPLTSLRKTIARRLTEAWTIPAFQISMSADMSRVNALRARMVESVPEGGTKPTVSDVLTKIAAVALIRHRAVNATFAGDAIQLHPTANVGLAVATERGLVVPVIRSAERLTIAEVAAARADVVGRARGGKLQQADLEDGTFTISNLGMYGVDQFVAVLNPPQAAILAVGAAEEKPVAVDGELAIRPMMTMTLTCDHRTIDGADASEFLRTVKQLLEEPGLAL